MHHVYRKRIQLIPLLPGWGPHTALQMGQMTLGHSQHRQLKAKGKVFISSDDVKRLLSFPRDPLSDGQDKAGRSGKSEK